MPSNKKKIVKVDVNGKTMEFGFHPVADDVNNPEELYCNDCPLNGFCELIPDPRPQKEKGEGESDVVSSFMDFCSVTGDLEVQEMLDSDKYENLVPDVSDVIKYTQAIGSDLYQKILEKDPYVKLSEVIDCVCGENGYPCPMYNKDHTNCNVKNGVCVLNTLFKL